MAHIKDIDERESGSTGRDAATPDDLMLVDLLYGELDENARERAEQRVREDQALGQDLDAFSNLRALMRELPEAEPPEALSAKLLHAAAAEVSGGRAPVADGEEPQSLWSRLKSLFLPIAMHPAFAAAASVMLVAGIAGVLYVSGDLKSATPRLESARQAELEVAAGAPVTMQAPEGAAAATAGAPAPVQAGEAADPAASRDESDGVVDGLAKGALARRPLDTTAASPRPEPEATGALADDYGAEEQSPRQFAQAPAEANEVPAGNALGGRGGYPDTDKSSPRLALRKPASEPQSKQDEAAESRRAKKRGKLELAESFASEPQKVATTADVSAPRSSAAPGSGQGASAGVVGGGGAPAQQKPATVPAKPKAQPTPAAPPPPQAAPPAEDRDQAEAAGDAEAPAARKAPARAEEKARERSDGSATRVREMHKKALAAAARGDCAAVRSSGNTIRQLDPVYHRDSFARDARLQECLSAAVKKK